MNWNKVLILSDVQETDGGLLTAEEFNSYFNTLIAQGNNNANGIETLVAKSNAIDTNGYVKTLTIPDATKHKIVMTKVIDGVESTVDLLFGTYVDTVGASTLTSAKSYTDTAANTLNTAINSLKSGATVLDKLVAGTTNTVSANCGAVGTNNTSSVVGSFVAGTYVTAANGMKAAFGKYNTDTATNVFEVGIGTGAGAKANAISVDNAGNLSIAGKLNASSITGVLDVAQIPAGAKENCVIVADDTARFALTTASVQQGDTVKVTATSKMYMVIDQTKLNLAAGYTDYLGSADWNNVTNKPSTFTPSTHTHSDATSGASGFMPSSDKLYLDSLKLGRHVTGNPSGAIDLNDAGFTPRVLTTGAVRFNSIQGMLFAQSFTNVPSGIGTMLELSVCFLGEDPTPERHFIQTIKPICSSIASAPSYYRTGTYNTAWSAVTYTAWVAIGNKSDAGTLQGNTLAQVKALATTSTLGMMSAADKTKLDATYPIPYTGKGTWSPVIYYGNFMSSTAKTAGVHYTASDSYYTKIGSAVTISTKITILDVTGCTGQNVFVGGLPFQPAAGIVTQVLPVASNGVFSNLNNIISVWLRKDYLAMFTAVDAPLALSGSTGGVIYLHCTYFTD